MSISIFLIVHPWFKTIKTIHPSISVNEILWCAHHKYSPPMSLTTTTLRGIANHFAKYPTIIRASDCHTVAAPVQVVSLSQSSRRPSSVLILYIFFDITKESIPFKVYTACCSVYFKGNQKGNITCYARERANTKQPFWMVITFLTLVVYS